MNEYEQLVALAKSTPEKVERHFFFRFPELGVYARDTLLARLQEKAEEQSRS